MDFLRESLKNFSYGFSRTLTDSFGTRALSHFKFSRITVLALRQWRSAANNPHRTSKFTLAPATTFCPAAGVCETMMLAGVGCGGGTGAGTVDGAFPGGGDNGDIPGAAVAAGAPEVVPAELAADGGASFAASGATLMLPNLNPESCNARLEVPSGCPMKLGITYA
jgi:hypothetical protein